MPPGIKFISPVGSKVAGAVGAAAFGLGMEQLVVPAYKMTVGSVLVAGAVVAVPAALGLMNVRLPNPEQFNVANRVHLKDTEPHVSNVNIVLDYLGLPVSTPSVNLILHQEMSDHTPGSPIDRAYEHRVATSFKDAYTHSVPTADSVEGMSLDAQKELRKQQAFDFAGSIAHTGFGMQKTLLYNLANPVFSKDDQLGRSEANKSIYKAKNNELKALAKLDVHLTSMPDFTSRFKHKVAGIRSEAILKEGLAKRESTPDAELPTTPSNKRG